MNWKHIDENYFVRVNIELIFYNENILRELLRPPPIN